MPYDHRLDTTCVRSLDVAMIDSWGANIKCERGFLALRSRAVHALVHLMCDARKVATVHTLTFNLLKPWDRRLIRLALSVEGMAMQCVRAEMRDVVEEQLVIMHSTRPTAKSTAHRRATYDIYFRAEGDASPKGRYRRVVV